MCTLKDSITFSFVCLQLKQRARIFCTGGSGVSCLCCPGTHNLGLQTFRGRERARLLRRLWSPSRISSEDALCLPTGVSLPGCRPPKSSLPCSEGLVAGAGHSKRGAGRPKQVRISGTSLRRGADLQATLSGYKTRGDWRGLRTVCFALLEETASSARTQTD